MRRWDGYGVVGATLLGALVLTHPSHGQTARELDQASAAFERGVAAQKRGDWAEAARNFGEADEIVADPGALEAALVAVVRSDDAVLGMELAARADRNPYRDRLTKLAEGTRKRFGPWVGRIVVHCEACTIFIDGAPARRGVATWVTTGAHQVTLRVAGEAEHREVQVEPAGIVTIVPLPAPSQGSSPNDGASPAPKQRPDEAQADSGDGLSPAFFWVGLALTGAAGGGTIASAVDTKNKHEAFTAAPSADDSIAGQNAETRTNVLAAITAGLGVTTTVVGLLALDWGDNTRVEGTLQLTPYGPRGLATVRF